MNEERCCISLIYHTKLVSWFAGISPFMISSAMLCGWGSSRIKAKIPNFFPISLSGYIEPRQVWLLIGSKDSLKPLRITAFFALSLTGANTWGWWV